MQKLNHVSLKNRKHIHVSQNIQTQSLQKCIQIFYLALLECATVDIVPHVWLSFGNIRPCSPALISTCLELLWLWYLKKLCGRA